MPRHLWRLADALLLFLLFLLPLMLILGRDEGTTMRSTPFFWLLLILPLIMLRWLWCRADPEERSEVPVAALQRVERETAAAAEFGARVAPIVVSTLIVTAMALAAIDGAAAPDVRTGVSAAHAGVGTAQPEQRRGHFKSGVELVLLDVCVKGSDGRLIETLRPEDFLVVEDGRLQRLTFFSPGANVPLAAVLLIDQSGSMAGAKLDRAKSAAVAFAGTLGPDDRVAIMTFNQYVVRRLPFGADLRSVEQAVAPLSPSGQTALFDAILVGLSELERDRRQRRAEFREAIVVLSDGEDTSSRLAFEDVREAIRRNSAVLYAVSLRADEGGRWLPPPYHLSTFAVDTGGRALTVSAPDRLAATYREIARELRHLYRLGYVSSNTRRDGAWRRTSVRVPDRDVNVQARAGYYAGW